jgi:hypothetical protein
MATPTVCSITAHAGARITHANHLNGVFHQVDQSLAGLGLLERYKYLGNFEINRQHLRKQEIYQYRYANQVPLRDKEPTL